MKKHTIPKENQDLRRYATWRNLWRLLGYIAYIAVLAAAFAFFLLGRHEDAEPLRWWIYPLYGAVVLVSGWFVFNMTRFCCDRTVSGVVSDMSYQRSFDRGLNRKAGLSIDDHTYVKMKLVTSRGRTRRIKVMLFDDGYDGYYAEGRTVVKYRGLNYPVCLESEEKGAHICAVCGVRTFYKEGKMIHGEAQPERQGELIICRSCRHTLIGK